MASMLEAFDFHTLNQIRQSEKEVNAVKKLQQHPILIEKKERLLQSRKEKIAEKRRQLEHFLQMGQTEQAKALFQQSTGENFIEIHPVYTRTNSPKQTLRQKHIRNIAGKGGPFHPSVLPNHVFNSHTKKVKNSLILVIQIYISLIKEIEIVRIR
jgi:hypothetical protein